MSQERRDADIPTPDLRNCLDKAHDKASAVALRAMADKRDKDGKVGRQRESPANARAAIRETRWGGGMQARQDGPGRASAA